MTTSRIPRLYELTVPERVRAAALAAGIPPEELASALQAGGLDVGTADQMIENALGVFGVPLGLATNFVVNGRERLVPMAVEEPSVVAAASLAAKIFRASGGFSAECDRSVMIAQVQLVGTADPARAAASLLDARPRLLAAANAFVPQLVARGGGAEEVEARVLHPPADVGGPPMVVLHILVDTCDAMGANLVNTLAEGVAPLAAEIAGGAARLKILSNLADRRLARARCTAPFCALAAFNLSGAEVAEGVAEAWRFAACDPYRAATHNKGVMNGIDAVALATGNDWRALEAGAHAYAARDGRYRPLSRWWIEGGELRGEIELPMQVGVVGGASRIHPLARMATRLCGVTTARELGELLAAVGLAQNFAALRALGTVGIQEGHMALHSRARGR